MISQVWMIVFVTSLFLSISPSRALMLYISMFCFLVVGLQTLSIYQNKDFITIYHGEQEGPNEFDTVLLKALVGGTNI